MSDPPPTVPPPAGNTASDRRFQARIAVIGLVGGLLGALIGGGATLIATAQQRQADATNQLKTERGATYLSYQDDMNTLYSGLFNLLINTEQDSKLLITRVAPLAPVNLPPSVTGDNSQLSLAADQMALIGSPRVRQIVNEQQSLAFDLFHNASGLAEIIGNPPRWPYSRNVVNTYLSGLDSWSRPLFHELSQFQKGMAKYADVAAIDLGTN